MNTTYTRKTLLTCAVSAVVMAAAGAAAVPGIQSSAVTTRHTGSVANSSATPALTALITPNRLYAATGAPPVVALGPSGSVAFPDGYHRSSWAESRRRERSRVPRRRRCGSEPELVVRARNTFTIDVIAP